jgi:hypothetical protein
MIVALELRAASSMTGLNAIHLALQNLSSPQGQSQKLKDTQ